MNRHAIVVPSLTAAIACSPLAFAGRNATFQIVPNFANLEEPAFCAGVSADGSTVFGILGTYGEGWIWSPTIGAAPIGGGRLCGSNANGTRIAGLMGDSGGMDVAGYWTLGPDWAPIGGMPGSDGCGQSLSTPYGMSRDGTVIAGLGWGGPSGCSALPFKWTQADGMTALPMLDSSHNAARVNAVSGNGQVFGGWEAQSDGTWRPVIWQNNGPSAIGDFDCNCGYAEILALNYDGTVATGYDENRGFIWTPSAGKVLLTNSAGLAGETFPMGISDNGRVIVGHYGFAPGTFYAQVWIDRQPKLLQDYLTSLGATGMDGYTLWTAAGVSADGTVIVGTARQLSTGILVPYRATIPPLAAPCPADINGTRNVNTDDLLAVICSWGACPAPCSASCTADVTRNCTVNTDDLLVVITSWGACP